MPLYQVTDTLPQGWALFAGYFLKCRQSDRKFEFLVSSTSVSLRVVDGNGVELWTTGRISPDGRYPYRLDWSPQGDLVVLDMDDKEFWRINVRQDYGFAQPLRLVFQSNSLELKDSAWRTIWGANIPVSTGTPGKLAVDQADCLLLIFRIPSSSRRFRSPSPTRCSLRSQSRVQLRSQRQRQPRLRFQPHPTQLRRCPHQLRIPW